MEVDQCGGTRPPGGHASNVHGSQFSLASGEQTALPADTVLPWVLRKRRKVPSDFQPSHDGYGESGGR